MKGVVGRISEWAVSNPAPAIAGVVSLVAIVGLIAVLRLSPDLSTDKLVDRGSSAYAATETFRERFGDEAIVVLARGDLRRIMLDAENVRRLGSLEGCLSGRQEGEGLPRVCQEIRELGATRVVFGPATFLNAFVIEFERQVADRLQDAQARAQRRALRLQLGAETPDEVQQAVEQATEAFQAEIAEEVAALEAEHPILEEIGRPALDNRRFVRQVVFGDEQPPETPNPNFGYLFPSSEGALISIRLEPDISDQVRREATALIRRAINDSAFRLERAGAPVEDGERADATYELSGVPVVLEGLADELGREILLLLGIAVVVMALTLMLAFDPPLRLLPVLVAIGAAALAFGLLAAIGGTLTMASVAVLPVVIGLGVDYAIQLQARFREAVERGERPAAAAVIAAIRAGPMIATAAIATIAGLLALVFSPLAMIREFALALAIGIFAALAISLTAGLAALSMAADKPRRTRRLAGSGPARLGRALARGGGRIGRATLAITITAPRTVLVLAAAVSALGWVAGTRTEVVSDVRELVPANLPALESVDALEEVTGVSGEINVTATGERVTTPAALTWMRDLRERVLAEHGFDLDPGNGDPAGCRDQGARLCPGPALSDLLRVLRGDGRPTRAEIEEIVATVPSYFLQGILSEPEGPPQDRDQTPVAASSFLIPIMPLDEQEALIDAIRAELDRPAPEGSEATEGRGAENGEAAAAPLPPGIEAEVVGLPVLVADANQSLSDSRYWLTGAALLAVALVLLVVYRSPSRALVPLIPITLATGWSALVLEALGVPLNPMSVTLSVLVIAIATEFSVILSARYAEERAAGRAVGEALRDTYTRTGRAVLASGITSIAGFGVLIASGITMLREFGLVTVVDLAVAIAGVMIVLPAALVWAESGFRPFGVLARSLRRTGGGVTPARVPGPPS